MNDGTLPFPTDVVEVAPGGGGVRVTVPGSTIGDGLGVGLDEEVEVVSPGLGVGAVVAKGTGVGLDKIRVAVGSPGVAIGEGDKGVISVGAEIDVGSGVGANGVHAAQNSPRKTTQPHRTIAYLRRHLGRLGRS